MGIMTQNACKWAWVLVLVVLAGVSPGIAEAPDLSGVSADERKMIESACFLEKSVGGPAAYNSCLASQLRDLNEAPTAPDLSGVGADERKMITEDHDIARSCLDAEQGDVEAQYILGVAYTDGEGVLQDYVKAHAWLNLAAAAGKEAARKARDSVGSRMTREQIADAQKLAAEFWERIESSKSKSE